MWNVLWLCFLAFCACVCDIEAAIEQVLEPPRVLATTARQSCHLLYRQHSGLAASASAATASLHPKSTAHGSTGAACYAVLSPTLKTSHRAAREETQRTAAGRSRSTRGRCAIAQSYQPERMRRASARRIRNAGIIAATAALAKRPLP